MKKLNIEMKDEKLKLEERNSYGLTRIYKDLKKKFFDLTTIKEWCGGKFIRVYQCKSVANLNVWGVGWPFFKEFI